MARLLDQRSGRPPGRPAMPALTAGLTVALSVGVLGGGCKPELGAPPSLIAQPQVLDVRPSPPEAKPGAPVLLEPLLVDPTGTLAPPVAWTTCLTPKPPAESNAVSITCVEQPDDDAPPVVGPITLTVPASACSLFGPLTPPAQPGQPPIRPRDPDPTGGFYQPVRAAVRRQGGEGGGGDLLGFALIRITCDLANAPTDVARAFKDPVTGYHANQAPSFEAVTVVDATGTSIVVAGPGRAGPAPADVAIRPGDSIELRASWSPEAAEVFPVFDPATRTLVDQREALRVSWFMTAGELLHDRTGREAIDPEAFSDNTWTAPGVDVATLVHFWVVLRDNRGGSDSLAFDLTVSP